MKTPMKQAKIHGVYAGGDACLLGADYSNSCAMGSYGEANKQNDKKLNGWYL